MADEIKHKIQIEGIYEIKNGKTHIRANNKFLDNMNKHIANWLVNTISNDLTGTMEGMVEVLKLGTDTTTKSTYAMTSLASPLSVSSTSHSFTVSNSSPGVWDVVYTVTWNAGAIANGTTIGEVGLYGNVLTSATSTAYSANQLLSRLSVADGDFTAFQVDASNPLTISYTIRLSFA